MKLFYFIKRNRFQKVTMVFLITLLIALPSGQIGVLEVSAAVKGDYEYKENGSGTVTITNYNGAGGDVVIPEQLGGKSVTTIGNSAFEDKKITSIHIPESVTTIETGAFGYNELTSVDIPDNVTTIGDYAFRNNKLTSIDIPDGITTIEAFAFQHNKLTSIDIPDGVKAIKRDAFIHNELTSVNLPDNVTTIEGWAFANNKLTSIDIPDSVTTIGRDAFANNELTSVNLPDNLTTVESFSFKYNKLTNIDIPDSVTTIERDAFAHNELTSVDISNNVTTIGNWAFMDNKLTNIIIPDGVTSIGTSVFLKNELMSVKIPDSVTSIGNKAFENNKLTSVEIPNSVKDIGDSAFANNQLINVKIPDHVTNIGTRTFADNELTDIIIPDSVKSIGYQSFENNKLTSVDIPNSVEEIDWYAFNDNQLTSIIIPDSVEYIGSHAFNNNQLTSIIIPGSVTIMGIDIFDNNDKNLVIIGELESVAEEYANKNEIPFLEINDPFKFKFEPNGSNDNWIQDAFTQVTVDGFGELELKYKWSVDSAQPPSIEGWDTFDNSSEIKQPVGGMWYLHVYAKDGNGMEKYALSDLFHVDNMPPKIDVKMLKDEDNDDYIGDTWTNQMVNVSVKATDEHSGIDSLQILIDGVEEEQHEFTLNESGFYKLSIIAIDKVGNKTIEGRIIKISKDGLMLETALEQADGTVYKSGDWTTQNVIVSMEVNNVDGAGITKQYSLDKGKTWKPYTERVTLLEGVHSIWFQAEDEAGNSLIEKETIYIDQTAPELTLRNGKTVNLLYGEEFDDPGYKVRDNLAQDLEVEVTGKVDHLQVGSYDITYSVTDHAGNETIVTRTVNVNDKEQPVITLNGDNPLTLEIGTDYKEPGATAEDNVDGNITDKITITGEVDTNKPGTYYLYYNVSDDSGNEAFEVVREVRVIAPDVVEIELGQSSAPVYAGTPVEIGRAH